MAGALLVTGLRRRSVPNVIGAGMALAMLVLGGAVYDAYFTGLAMAILVIVEALAALRPGPWRAAGRRLLDLTGLAALAVLVMVGVAAVKLFPVIGYQPISTRVGFSLQEAEIGLDSMPTASELLGQLVAYLPTTVIPGISYVLLISALAALLRPTRIVGALGLMALIGFWASLGSRAPLDLYAFFHAALPGFEFNNGTLRFMNLFYFSYAALAAVGATALVDIIRRRVWSRSPLALAIIAGLVIGVTSVGAALPMRETVAKSVDTFRYEASPTSGSLNAALADLERREGPHSFRVYSTYVFQRDDSTVTATTALMYGYDITNPTNVHMVPSYQFMPTFSQDQTIWQRSLKLLSILNARYLVFQREYTYLGAGVDGPLVEVPNGALYRNSQARDRAAIVPHAVLLIGEDTDGDFNALEARLIVVQPNYVPRETAVYHGRSAYLDDYSFETLSAFDAVVLSRWRARDPAAAAVLLGDFRRRGGVALDLAYDELIERNPFRRSSSMLTQVNPPKRLRPESEAAVQTLLTALSSKSHASLPVVTMVAYTPTAMKFHVGATDRYVPFVFSQTYFPGWSAEVDGARADLYMADSLINGVVLPPGPSHTVVFRFLPQDFVVGGATSLVTLALVGAVFARALRRRRQAY